jgi:electron transport complex protein RnfE
MGLGFTIALTLIGIIREFLTSGSAFGVKIVTVWETEFLLASASAGAFIVVGCVLAARNAFARRKAIKEHRLYVPPQGLEYCNASSCHGTSLTRWQAYLRKPYGSRRH